MCGLRCDLLRCCDAASWCCDVLRCCGASFCCFCRSRSCCFCSLFHISSSFHGYGEITMKAFRPSPFTGDMHTERRIFGIASRCGTFGTRHTEMVLSARQAFQPPHIICMFFARHIQLCFRLSQVARPLGRGGASAGRGTPQYERSPVSGLYVS